MWEASRAGCKCDYSPGLCSEVYSSAYSLFWVDKWCCRSIGFFRGDKIVNHPKTTFGFLHYQQCGLMLCLVADSDKWYGIFGTNERDIWASWCGSERYPYIGEVFAGLLHKHTEEVEGPQGPIQAKRFLHLKGKQVIIFVYVHEALLFKDYISLVTNHKKKKKEAFSVFLVII